jgi:cyclin D5, plant
LKDAMGDAAAASSPTTPTSILVCREDGNDIFLDFDDGADVSVAGDECLLVVDHDDEYFAVLLSKERASADAGAPAEMDVWMKAARSGCVRWIIKVARAFLPLSLRSRSPCGNFDLFR